MLVILRYLPTVPALVITVLTMGLCLADCPEGWIGNECDVKCHCIDHCDFEDEVCYECEYGFFGPACQFYDAVYWYGSNTNAAFLMTRNITSCNPGRFAKSVKLSFTQNLRFSWLRLHVNDGSVLNDFQIKLNDVANSCVKERRYNITQTTVFVSCDTTVLVKLVTIEGAVAPNVCTVYVSAGRNVALKQPAQQTSTATPEVLNMAAHAVDGIKNDDSDAWCSRTQHGHRSPEWNVTLNHQSFLYRVLIYSCPLDKEITGGFTLITQSSTGIVLEKLRSPSAKDATFEPYEFVLQSQLPVQSVKIIGAVNVPLSLCEVYLFGEQSCPDLRYGLSCKKKCQCKGHEICEAVTGKCAPGCPVGFYGFQCGLACNSSCGGDPCLQVSGECYRCPSGYTGDDCDEDCHGGFYGKSCEEQCPENCVNECDPIDGYCECAPGYRQPKCTECHQGTFGSQCIHNCSTDCLHHNCHHITGLCSGCEGSRIGPHCEDCPHGKYGNKCSFNCSEFCVNRICDPVTGNCLKCMPGRIGPKCTECPNRYYGYSCNATCPTNCESGLCHISTGLCLSCASDYAGPTCSRAVGYKSKLIYYSPLLVLCVIPFIILLLRKRDDDDDNTDSKTTVRTSRSLTGEEDTHAEHISSSSSI